MVLPLERFALSGLGGSPGRLGEPKGGSDGAQGRSGGSPGVVFGSLEAPRAPCRSLNRRSVLRSSVERKKKAGAVSEVR